MKNVVKGEELGKLISIIVPVYKIKEKYLRKCVESMMNQHTDDYKIILIDDGSPDHCGILCDEFASETDKITVIHQKNQGVAAARNAGIDAADTPWITFVDPDDWIEDFTIKKEIELIKALEASVDIIMFDYTREYIDKSVIESLSINNGLCNDELIEACQRAPFFKLIQKGYINPYSINALWNKVYRKEFITKNNIYFVPEARKGQDRLFNAEAFNSTDKIYYLRECLYHYRCNDESVSNKYNKNIVELTNIEICELERLVDKYNLSFKVKNLLDARICTRLYSCMRLYFFNSENPLPVKRALAEFRELVENEPYKTAIKTVSVQYLSTQEKIFLYMLKFKMYKLCGALVKIKATRFGDKLIKG